MFIFILLIMMEFIVRLIFVEVGLVYELIMGRSYLGKEEMGTDIRVGNSDDEMIISLYLGLVSLYLKIISCHLMIIFFHSNTIFS